MSLQFYNSLGFDGSTPDGSTDDAVNKSDILYRIVESFPRNYKDPNSKAPPFPASYIDVKTQLPTWLVNLNEPFDGFLINIMQNYYDWLYNSDSGSGFYLDDKFATLKDNELAPQSLINLLLTNYFPEANALMDVYVLSSQLNYQIIILSFLVQ
jgi:peptidoglycan/xylan/chitin deacetylase (PgdA/CDA1 family)